MAPNPNPSVLIVGAGPTGLVLGTELRRRGIHVRLVDKEAHPSVHSRAFAVHSRTLEMFETMGIGEEALARAHLASFMRYHFVRGDGKVESLELPYGEGAITGRFPWLYTMSQTVTEEISRAAFEGTGGVIEWGVCLEGFEEVDGVVKTVLSSEGREDERAEFAFLAGCDGAWSTVRKGLDLKFSGGRYTGMTMKMIDVSLHNSVPDMYGPEGYHYFIDQGSMLLLRSTYTRHADFFPLYLPGSLCLYFGVLREGAQAKMGDAKEYGDENDVWRIVISTTEKEPDVSIAAFQAAVDRVLVGVTVGEPIWTSSYKIHKRMASSYRSEGGRILLAGDSAHINSPAGGMGMNCAIQDGFSLGWRLAMVVNGLLRKEALQDYEKERRPIAQEVLDAADLLHSIIMDHAKGLSDRISLASSEKWAESVVKVMSGNSFSYAASSRKDSNPSKALTNAELRVCAGDHAPDILVHPLRKSGDICRLSRAPGFYFTVIAFCNVSDETGENLEGLFGGGIVNVVRSADPGVSGSGDPTDSLLLGQYGSNTFGLVRPDKYILSLFPDVDSIVDEVQCAISAVGVGVGSS